MSKGLLGLYVKSPFRILEKHGKHVVDSASQLPGLTKAFVSGDQVKMKEIAKLISDSEHAADEVKNELRLSLPKGMFLPVDRRDLLHFLSAQDSIADDAQDAAALMAFRPVKLEGEVLEALVFLSETVLSCVEEFGRVVSQFQLLVEASFRGPDAEEILNTIQCVGEAESKTDRAQEKVAQLIFSQEFSGDPVEVYLLSKITDRLGDVADTAERAANRLRMMLSL